MKSNSLKIMSAVAVLSLAGIANAKANTNAEYVATDDSVESEICVAATHANKQKMDAKLEASFSNQRLSKKYDLIANNLTCNDTPVAEFALEAGNYELAKKLAEHMDNNITIHDIAKRDEKSNSDDS